LTKGQASPTSDTGFITKTTPDGADPSMNPVGLAVAGGATFVARGFAGDIDHLSGIIQEGIKHKGFSLIDILQPCVSFNHKNTFQWYRERVYKLEDKDYDPTDMRQVKARVEEWGDRIPLGIFYRQEKKTFEEHYGALGNGPLVKQNIEPARTKELLKEFY
jgi:2-oxoglutarate ferredoxin oxidoreductase subunit beta